jgi:glycerate 2-kinase
MKILIAPDKFKGSLGAREVADNIAAGLRDVLPNATLEIVPVADGGEGTADVICQACAGEWVTCNGHDALGRAITARYVWLPERLTAVMEMSETAGMWRIAPHERDPLSANTYGVGEMLLEVGRRKTKEVIVGLGGSATNDGGVGMARALGFRFFADGLELMNGPAELIKLTRVVRDVAPLHLPRIIAASDVRTPLLGTHGATRTFGPQKGVASDQLEVFEQALVRLADVVARDLGCDFREEAGAGAAGGLGFGLLSFCGATIRPGFDLVAELLDLGAAIERADVVITGEGRFDDQTLEGKAPAGVARLARKLGKRIFAIVGCATEQAATREVFDAVFLLAQPPVTREESMKRTATLLRERARELGATLSLSRS